VLLRARGASLADPKWTNMGNPTHEPRSFHAQPTYVVGLTDKKKRPYFMLMSDNWVRAGPRGLQDAGYVAAKGCATTSKVEIRSHRVCWQPFLNASQIVTNPDCLRACYPSHRRRRYIWLPLIFHDHSVRLQRLSNWTTDRPLKTAR